ncbi:DoxX family membrane protein [Sphaerisporangium aureirubrum]|uniref:DoxX family membrane protein n=1 Tax=Sphaerisporangium aureirubrum TaxID=1544736 RepID=A0ABW1NBP2_9ACTN
MRRTFTDIAALAARLGVGGIFFANGWHKLESGLNATQEQFARMDAPVPGLWAAGTMLIELIGGALMVAGLFVPACGIILFAEALAVFVLVSGDVGLPLTGGDINLIVALGAASVLLAVVGAGRLSVDHLVVIRRREAEADAEMSADAEADDVIASWRDSSRPPATDTTPPADATTAVHPKLDPKPSPKDTPVKGPVTFPESSPRTEATDSTAARKTRPRRTTKPTDDTSTESPAPPPTAPHDRLVAGTRKTPTPTSD